VLSPPPYPGPRAATPGSGINRRRLLTDGSRAALALVVLGPVATACGVGKAPEPDPLEAQLEAARSDSTLAKAAATGTPAMAPALLVVAAEREQHATALIEELARAAGKPTPDPTATPAAEATTAAAASEPPAPPPTVRQVADALRRSADSAAAQAPTLAGYRAGLLGSIAASCTALHTVGLLPRERKKR